MGKIHDRLSSLWHQLKFRVRYSRNVFEDEVVDIRMSNENIKRYSIQNLRKDFFSISIKTKDDIFKYLFYLVMLFLLVLLPYASIHTGISEKEVEQQERAEMLYAYYAHNDTTILQSEYAQTHTQMVDFICCSLCKLLNINNVYLFRHITGALFAWFLVLLVGSFLMNLFAWRAAFFGVMFMMISPHFIGQSFGNLADVPFALFYLLAIYQIYTFIGELPIVKWKRLVFIILAIVFANSIHIGGFVLIRYFIIFSIISFVVFNPLSKVFTKKYLRNFFKLVLILIGTSAVIYAFSCFLPLHLTHFSNAFPHNSIAKMAQSQPVINFLWKGDVVSSHDLSWSFVLSRMQLTIPLLITLGCVLHLVVLRTIVKTVRIMNYLLLLFALVYPFWCLTGETYEIYDGWAIYLMVYPLVIMFSVGGVAGFLRKVDDKYTNFVIVSGIILLALMPTRHVLLHNTAPSTYFNELSGGISAAYGKYPIDFDEQSNKLACEWLLHNNTAFSDSTKVQVYTDGSRGCDFFFDKDTARYQLTHKDFNERDTVGWDYFISFVDQIPASQLRNKSWEATPSIKCFYIESRPVAIILRNEKSALFAPPLTKADTLHAQEITDSIPNK